MEQVHGPMDRVHSLRSTESMDYIKLGPFKSRWRASIDRHDSFFLLLIRIIRGTMDD
jgi:hypothetical protein